MADEVAWWKERLGDDGSVLELPSDRPRPPAPSYNGARDSLTFPAARVAVDSGAMRPAEAAERIRAALGLG